VCFDLTFVPLVEKLAPACPNVTTWVALTDRAHMPATDAAEPRVLRGSRRRGADDYEWPELDENTAAALCYTSGTTGNPKGALFSATARRCCTRWPAACRTPRATRRKSVVLPIVPMFHVNAWGIRTPRRWSARSSCFRAGPRRQEPVRAVRERRVETSAGVPTVWLGVINYMKQNNLSFTTFKSTTIGGSACPAAMMQHAARRLSACASSTAGA
jgi:fatty-acyl-CoA synthase